MLEPSWELPTLPPPADFETAPVLRAVADAHRRLAELKGRAHSVPNPGVLIDTLSLQEAVESSEIENIVTTRDKLFQATLFREASLDASAKEVARYREALQRGFGEMTRRDGLLTNNVLIEIYRALMLRTDGFRAVPGTALLNERSGEIVYVPPQEAEEIVRHMTALERFINDDGGAGGGDDGGVSGLDPLVRMAVIHHQFESIHPFSDGNGRVGRILNVLYLVRMGLLDFPILYLSRAINRSKAEYYRLLQAVRDDGAWEAWALYVLRAVSETSREALRLVERIDELMLATKHEMRGKLPKIYSQDLLNNLFRHPYTKIGYVREELGVSRQTASRYLERLAAEGFLDKRRSGSANYYVNPPLVALFAAADGEP